jgi:hypothetical protein
MHITQIVMVLTDVGLGILYILVSLPSLLKRSPINWLYPLRDFETFKSDKHWHAIIEYQARAPIGWALGLIAVGIITLFLPVGDLVRTASPDSTWPGYLPAVPPFVCLGGAIVQTYIYAWIYARRRSRASRVQ